MSGIGSGYDVSTDTFSADGRIFQVEYACKAVDNSSTTIGLCCTDGVVVAAERIHNSKMLEPQSNSRIYPVDRQAGICVCGMLPDGKNIVVRAREEASSIRKLFSTPALGATLADRIGQYMHLYTTYYSVRPFGASAIMASYSDDGPQLFVADPTGTVAGYHGCALGKGKTEAKTEIEKLHFPTLKCRDAVKAACSILYQVHDSVKDKLFDVEVGWVCDESNRVFTHVPKELIPPPPSA